MTTSANKPHESGTRRKAAGHRKEGGTRSHALPPFAAGSNPDYLGLLYASARTANAALSGESAVREIMRLILEATRWSAAHAFLHLGAAAGSGRWAVVAAGATIPPPDSVEGISTIGPAEDGLAALALADGQVHYETLDSPGPAGLRCGCAMPIRQQGGDSVGVIEFFSERDVRVDAALLDALAEIGDQLARVIARGWAQRAGLRQQEELALTGRLASMRELARNLAHEVNQPLAAVVGYAGGALQLLEQGRADEEKMRRALEQVGVQAKRASGIIQEFREFLRREESRHERVELSSLICEAVALAREPAREAGIAVVLDVPPELPRVIGDPVQLQQVLINLIQNAIESMSAPEVKERRLEICAGVSDQQVDIRIRDSGTGMAPDLVPQLFTPFLTTKPHGLGMGLPISRSIVEFHGGRLGGENNSDAGMSFRIRLPLAKS